jgi:hypothetical protein
MRALAVVWLLLLTSVTVALASDWGFVPPPEPAWGPPACNLGSVLENNGEFIHAAVICNGPLGPIIVDYVSGKCSRECQRICMEREGN